MGIEDWQKTLLDEARLESHGTFQLDPKAALEKLQKYQHSEIRAYILKLVQWAVASGAESVRLEIDHDKVVVEHDGRGMPREKFPPGLLQGHLGTAMVAIYLLTPREIIFESQDYLWRNGDLSANPPRKGSRITLLGLARASRWQPLPMLTEQRRLTFAHVDTDGVLGELIWDSLGFVRPELALVRQRCFLAGIPIFLNGKLVNRPAGLAYKARDQNLELSTVRPVQSKFKFILDPQGGLCAPAQPLGELRCSYWDSSGSPTDKKGHRFLVNGLRLAGANPLRARAVLYYSSALLELQVVHWVQDGVIVEIEWFKTGPCMYIYCEARGMQTDLSQFKLVRDGAYHSQRQWLKLFQHKPKRLIEDGI